MRVPRRWLALPVILAVSIAVTAYVRTRLAGDGDGGTPVPAGPVALTQEQVRQALSRPPAPVEFREFSTPLEENPLPVGCFDRFDAVSGGTSNALGGLIAGPVLAAPVYRLGDVSVTVQIMRIRSDAVASAERLLRERSQCTIDGYNGANEPLTYWGTHLPLSMGDAAVAIHRGERNTESAFPEGAVTSTDMVAVSGTWLAIAGGGGGTSVPDDPERLLSTQAAGVLAAPALLRKALEPFDQLARTNFSRSSKDRPATCSAEAMDSGSMARTTGLLAPVVLAVHDAACRGDADWLARYVTPVHFRNGRLFTLDAHSTAGDAREGIPFATLAAAIEAGPRTDVQNRHVYTSERWTFIFESRINTLAGFLGMSDQCGSSGTSDPVCEAAKGRGVVGLDWEPPALAASCDGLPVETRQRLYTFARNPKVPDLVVRSACRASTGSWPIDVTVLDGGKSGTSAAVLQHLVSTSDCLVTGDAYEEDGFLVVPVHRDLCADAWEEQTVRYRWDGSRYRRAN
jgi:hypothetical protein